MILSSLHIKGFRNFKDIELDLTNKNIIFGLNDIGKTNFLCALRFLLDRDFRRFGFSDTDFYNKKIKSEIQITLTVNIEDENDEDNKKIYTAMKGAIPSNAKEVYFQLKSTYDRENLRGEPRLYWGAHLTKLEEIPSRQSYFSIDRLFNVVYIDSSIQLDNVFRRYTKEILRGETSLSEVEREDLNKHINNLNESVSDLTTIKKFEADLVDEYKKYRDEKDLNLSIKSEIELNNLHSKLTPYILIDDSETYPTAGDGRKKILAYTLLSLENREKEEKKINVFLIEELENHLHRSMQIALSYQLFTDEIFKHLFMTTHSSLIVSQMNNVNLIKLFKDDKITGKSHLYTVPKMYINLKQKLNQRLAEAIYADVVLLVEGPSEKILFERILSEKCERYESLGGYILEVDGINFKEYYQVLTKLGIKVIVKTDNDLKLNREKQECNLLGLNRCLTLVGKEKKPNINKIDISEYEKVAEYKKGLQREIFEVDFKDEIDKLKKMHIFLSKVDLENDLYEVVPLAMERLVEENNSSKSAIDYLQSSKLVNMIKLCLALETEECNLIYKNEMFYCLKELVESCSQ